ncbi:immunity 63 family protein [Erwinia sp. D4-22]
MLLSIHDLQQKIDELCLKIGVPRHSINLCTAPVGDGTPYISFENNKYNYIYTERDYEISRKITDSSEELLYWIMYDFVHAIAVKYELNNRIVGKDSRRIYFPKIVEIMNVINPEWGVKAKKYLDGILTVSPYEDELY